MRSDEILRKYKKRLEESLKPDKHSESFETKHYLEFKKTMMPKEANLYEKMAKFSERLVKISPDKKTAEKYRTYLDDSHLNISPTAVVSFAILAGLLFAVIGSLFGYLLPLWLADHSTLFFVIFSLIIGLIMMFVLQKLPYYFSRKWRLAASNQMVVSIFYIVTYMRHTSNLENALNFASEHLTGPLALDFKKILWNVETERHESIQASIEAYLTKWKDDAPEFIEAIHLIEASLLESSEDRRLSSLDKSLDVILERTYEKMLRYAHNLKSPLTILHMMGIILPVLGLVILPLIVNILGGIKWYFIAAIYNVLLPLGVFLLGKNILASRPTGYGDVDISEFNPELKKLKKIKFLGMYFSPLMLYTIFVVFFVVIGMLPLGMAGLFESPEGATKLPDLCISKSMNFFNPALPQYQREVPLLCMLEFRQSIEDTTKVIGPFGIGASLFSILVVFGVGVGIGLYYKTKSKNIIEIRNATKKLEDEFTGGLFQLGMRMSDGLPAEVAFQRVGKALEGTNTGRFFSSVANNISRLGMSLKQAIFDPKAGVIISFPSNMIKSSMKVVTEAVRKGPRIAAQALMNISRYIKEIHKVNERLKDLMGDIITNMKTQISFLAPSISAIVVGITSMVTYILGKLSFAQEALSAGGEIPAPAIVNLFAGDGVPTFHFQIIVGIYLVQLVYILTTLSNAIENGTDKLNEEYMLGKNLVRSTMIYCSITLVVIIAFNLLAGVILARPGIL